MSESANKASGRREERHDTDVLALLDQGTGRARNLSASGVYIETDVPLAPGAIMNFSLRFEDAVGGPLVLNCEARVVRVEDRGGRKGVGATITTYKLSREASKVLEPA